MSTFLRFVGALGAVLLLTACSSSGSWSEARVAARASATVPTGGFPTGGSPTGGSPTAGSPTRTRLPLPAPSAANGTDVRACREARCEILVRGRVTVPLSPRFGFTTFTITFVPPNRTLFAAADAQGGSFQGEIGGMGELSTNGIVVRVIAVGPAGAVLRFAPRS